VTRLLASLLASTILAIGITSPSLVPDARASDWQFDLSAWNICVIGEGDPDTPDLRGTKYQVLDREGNVVQVDQAWLLSVLVATFGNWFDLVD
jgi:hypothetical protein